MSKRRDSKNRVLRTGENQRKDGRYFYKYIDPNGQTRFVYSWKLERTDSVPAGKKDDLSLREKIKQIQRDLDDGLMPNAGNITVLQLVEKYLLQKTGVSYHTEAGYRTVVSLLEKDAFGRKKIDKIKQSDAKAWLIKLQKNGRSFSSIHSIRGVLRPAFKMAVDDDILRKSPFDFELATVIVNDSVTREAITRKQEKTFLEFVKFDEHFKQYYDGIYILFKTGMRISEFCGLTKYDLDMDNRRINIDHQLQRVVGSKLVIVKTKTDAGTRILPMDDEVYDCFERILKNRKKLRVEPMVDGKAGFLYFNRNNKPLVGGDWAKIFQHICEKYNNIYKQQLPKITPHVCRHTYCSNMAKSGMNPKTLQYLMGHSEIGVTLDTYTHIGFDDAKDELDRLKSVPQEIKPSETGQVIKL